MKMTEYRKDGWAVVELSGFEGIGDASASLLEERLMAHAENLNGVILDMQHVDFVDSNAMGSMFSAQKKLREFGKDVILVGLHSSVVSVLKLVQLDKVFSVYPDVDTAIRDHRPGQKPTG